MYTRKSKARAQGAIKRRCGGREGERVRDKRTAEREREVVQERPGDVSRPGLTFHPANLFIRRAPGLIRCCTCAALAADAGRSEAAEVLCFVSTAGVWRELFGILRLGIGRSEVSIGCKM